LDIHHLRVFQAAARTASFTTAGRDLSLSQSTVSLHIKHLEEEFGCQLFHRSAKRVWLSEAGRVLLQYADRIQTELKNADLAVREFSTSQQGTVRFGVGATTLVYFLPSVLAKYRRKYPLIELRVTTGVTEVLLQSLMDHTLDMAIVMSPSEALAEVQSIPLMTEELGVALNSRHPLAQKAVLQPNDLKDLTFISHLRGTAMETVQQGYFRQLGVKPRIIMEMENMQAITSVVSVGLGAALLPQCCISGLQGRGIAYKKVRGLPMSRSLFIAALDWQTHPPATRRLAARVLHALASPQGQKEARQIIDVTDDSD
jgi:DNA-binding transcriptional LysR family regulator